MSGGLTALLLLVLVSTAVRGEYFDECDFWDPECGWSWSKGWNLMTAQNLTALGLGTTAPAADSHNNVTGTFLYGFWSEDNGSLRPERLEIVSPVFEPYTLLDCSLEISLHMYQMDTAWFQVVIKVPNSTWESTRFSGSSTHKWETKEERIGLLSQPFRVILEILNRKPAFPSHVAIDDIRAVGCYDRKLLTTDCHGRQFQCSDLICIEESQVCDITPHCTQDEDEDQDCDKMPEGAYCSFENGWCGWHSNDSSSGKWILRKGEDGYQERSGPSVDHTKSDAQGIFLLAKFPPGRVFGSSAYLISPWFTPPPYYHRNVHSAYYNSCQVRFYFHKFGSNIGELRLYSNELDPISQNYRQTDLWRSFGNKGDVWWNAIVTLPNMTNMYQLLFIASKGVRQSDISIDDVSLSPECFGIGVPENESIAPTSMSELETISEKTVAVIKKYMFTACGARGRTGPMEAQCREAYRDTDAQVTVLNEPALEGIQKWRVPKSGLYTAFVKGAGGGNCLMSRDGDRSMGTTIRATFEWMEGDEIYILVGQKGFSVGKDRRLCSTGVRRNGGPTIGPMDLIKRMKDVGAGGGGGTYIFMMDPLSRKRHPIIIAGGGGGLSSEFNDTLMSNSPHGLPPNGSILPINGYSGSGAGGGGGWDDNTLFPQSGWSLTEGGRGGESCAQFASVELQGGFGGGGGGCSSGGGGGGYRGGDASENDDPYHNGQGGTSFLHAGAIRVLVEPGSNPNDGAVIILPAQEGCGCQYLCVYLDLQYVTYYCICPAHLTIGIDGYSCNGHAGVSLTPGMLVGIILGVFLFIAITVICVFFGWSKYHKEQRRRPRDASDEPLGSPEEQLFRIRNSRGMVSENNPNYEFGGNTCTEQDLKKVSREHLTLVKGLGQGAFGEVYEGYLTNPTDNTEQPVAVKTLPELSSSQAILDFLMEALIMSKFNHPNIVSFIGVCFEKLPRFIVLELLPGGDLKSFLRECRPKPSKPSTLTVTDLLMLALDVAKGCQYLEENHFIHRDIAARNCLLTTKNANRVVKIADFGMARDIYRADYYRKGGKAMLPVKWMPPEAFLDGIFTSKTDVWSFGVLLWEVVSLGYMPYPGRGNQEVMQLVTSGGRLEPPTNCPSPVYHVMMQCWHPHPDERPTFTTIIERLGYCLQDPDVINAPLPIFNRAPSMERDATVMRPVEDESGCCLQVKRPEPCVLLSPGSEDYLIPNRQSSYSLTTDLQSSPSQGSADQLLELEDRSRSPSSTPTVWETNFTTPLAADRKNKRPATAHPAIKRQDGYTEVPTEDTDATIEVEDDINDQIKQNGYVARKNAARMSSIKSLDDLPVAPKIGENENNLKNPESSTSTKHRSNLSLDPRALVRQMSGSEPTNLPPNRYVNVDVNCNTGDSNPSLSRMGLANRNSVAGPFDGYSGVNPVA